ncbi:MAG: hypothetical protein H6Q00_381 [Holophagaceae bacterium]|nr:hypothetical protein [Holophagaceae bacterium]
MTQHQQLPGNYPIRFDTRIDWCEVDPFGHVNNLAIMRYVQSARVHASEEIGMMQHHAATGVGPVLVSTACQFKKQLYYPGNVTVLARVDHLKTTSFHLHHVVLNDAREIVAEAQDVLVFVDFKLNTKCPIPDEVRAKFLSLGAKDLA